MASKRRKKKSILRSTFYRVYFAVVILVLVGIAIGTVWLRGVLADYESAQPKYVAEEVARMFENADYDAIYALDTSAAQFSGSDKALYVDTLKELAQGKEVAWSDAFSSNPDERKYNVTLDGERVATFTLVPSGERTPKGNRLWKLGSVTTLVALQQATPEPTPEPTPEIPEEAWLCRITAPAGYTVTVDGETLSSENAQTSEKQLFEAGFLPDTVPNPTMIEYLYNSPTQTPEIHAMDESGAETAVTAVPDRELTWTCSLKEDEVYRSQYGDAAISLAKQVAKFINKDAKKKAIQKICAKGSPAEEIFENLSNRYTTPHTGISFRDERVSEFYNLSDDCFTCHVDFEVVLKTEKGDSVYPTSYTFCVIRQDGKGWLYNLQIY